MNRGLVIALCAGGAAAAIGGIAYAATRKKDTSLDKVRSLALLANLPNVAYASNERMTSIHGMLANIEEAQGSVPSFMGWRADQAKQEAQMERWATQILSLLGGTGLVVDEPTFRKLYTHGLKKVFTYVPSYVMDSSNHVNLGVLANHADCQTFAAALVNLGNEWEAPFYEAAYRYPSANPIYAGNPIDPQIDPGAYDDAVHAAMESAIARAMKDAVLVSPDGEEQDKYLIVVPNAVQSALANFAREMAKQKHQYLPETDEAGNVLPDRIIELLHASIGASIASGLITTFESSDPDVNPCIRVLDAGLVLEMMTATIGTVLTLAIGPAISATALVIKIIATIQKLSSLAQ